MASHESDWSRYYSSSILGSEDAIYNMIYSNHTYPSFGTISDTMVDCRTRACGRCRQTNQMRGEGVYLQRGPIR
eukprot:1625738-Pyramimonas_sp.AAC.2